MLTKGYSQHSLPLKGQTTVDFSKQKESPMLASTAHAQHQESVGYESVGDDVGTESQV